MARGKARRGAHRKFGSVSILSDGRIRFSEWTLPGLAQLDFLTVQGEADHRGTYSVQAHWRGKPIFILFVEQERVDSACFSYQLTPDELREAVSVVKDAGNGLERWVTAGLEWTQDALKDRPELQKVIPALLKSVAALPVAKQWQRKRREIQREWAAWRQQNPDATADAAPWVLKGTPIPRRRKSTRVRTR